MSLLEFVEKTGRRKTFQKKFPKVDAKQTCIEAKHLDALGKRPR